MILIKFYTDIAYIANKIVYFYHNMWIGVDLRRTVSYLQWYINVSIEEKGDCLKQSEQYCSTAPCIHGKTRCRINIQSTRCTLPRESKRESEGERERDTISQGLSCNREIWLYSLSACEYLSSTHTRTQSNSPLSTWR